MTGCSADTPHGVSPVSDAHHNTDASSGVATVGQRIASTRETSLMARTTTKPITNREQSHPAEPRQPHSRVDCQFWDATSSTGRVPSSKR